MAGDLGKRLGDEVEPRQLVAGQAFAAEGFEFGGIGGRVGQEAGVTGLHRLAPLFVGRDHDGFGHRGVGEQDVLDLGGRC